MNDSPYWSIRVNYQVCVSMSFNSVIRQANSKNMNFEESVFDSNLQEFAYKVSYIANLESTGKLSPQDSYEQIQSLWQSLTRSKEMLKISDHPFQS